jgi:hypothetical protein
MLHCSNSEVFLMKRHVISIVSAMFLAAFAPQSQAADQSSLSPAQLGQLFPGNFTAVVNGALTVKIVARGNGTLFGQMNGRQDSGRWRISGGKLCIVWSSWMGGKTSCSSVKSGDGWYHGNGVKFRKI